MRSQTRGTVARSSTNSQRVAISGSSPGLRSRRGDFEVLRLTIRSGLCCRRQNTTVLQFGNYEQEGIAKCSFPNCRLEGTLRHLATFDLRLATLYYEVGGQHITEFGIGIQALIRAPREDIFESRFECGGGRNLRKLFKKPITVFPGYEQCCHLVPFRDMQKTVRRLLSERRTGEECCTELKVLYCFPTSSLCSAPLKILGRIDLAIRRIHKSLARYLNVSVNAEFLSLPPR